MPKKIVIISPERDCKPWIKALQKEDPNLLVEVYPEDTHRNKTNFILTWNPPKDVFKKYPNVKLIASMGAGIRHISKENTIPKNTIVTKINDPQLKKDLSVFALTLILNHIRNIPTYFQQQQDKHWNRFDYKRPAETNVGIMGFGSIGHTVGELLVDNNFKVSGWSKSKKEHPRINTFAGEQELGSFLKSSHILICLLPLTDETTGILSKKVFQQLPAGAYLINLGRGPHVVEKDLKEALQNNRLSGAALDVFQKEPLPKTHWFWEEKNIQITPHTASLSDPSSIRHQIIENLHRLYQEKEIKHKVSLEKGY